MKIFHGILYLIVPVFLSCQEGSFKGNSDKKENAPVEKQQPPITPEIIDTPKE